MAVVAGTIRHFERRLRVACHPLGFFNMVGFVRLLSGG